MSAALPDRLDAWRAVAARRQFEGVLPLAALTRLAPMLADREGEVRYAIAFDRDEHGAAFVEVVASVGLPLVCQRTLERFVLPVRIEQRLGIVRSESDEASLPPGWEPLLAPDGAVDLAAVLEDELILAVPLVPVGPGELPPDGIVWSTVDRDTAAPEAPGVASPFAALDRLRRGDG